MPFTSKRSQSMMGKTNAKKSKQVHGEPSSPDEAPAPATKRCRCGYPAPVAARNAPPPSAHRPVRYPRPPDLYESVCALSPTELMYHLYEMPAELALPVVHTADEYSAAERKEMDAMSERHELLFPDDGSEL